MENAKNVSNINPETPYEKVLADCMTDYLEMRKAEEQGLLLRLPCKVGDKVYDLIPRVRGANNFRENEVVSIKLYCDSVYLSLKYGLPKDIKQIGKILFLTREEAEQALKRMESE